MLQRLLADEFGGFCAERREVDLGGPLGCVAADEDIGHAGVGEDRLEAIRDLAEELGLEL